MGWVSAVHLDHPLAQSVELSNENHSGGVLASRWSQHFMVVGVGIAVDALFLTVVNDGDATGHKET